MAVILSAMHITCQDVTWKKHLCKKNSEKGFDAAGGPYRKRSEIMTEPPKLTVAFVDVSRRDRNKQQHVAILNHRTCGEKKLPLLQPGLQLKIAVCGWVSQRRGCTSTTNSQQSTYLNKPR